MTRKKQSQQRNGDQYALNSKIAEYFDTKQIFYTHFWSRTALHYGLWYDGTKNLAEAIVNTNRFVVDALTINSHDLVLDAGCGVGGTSLYIAETTGARVEGITLSNVQLEIAKERATQSVATHLVNFSRQDYNCTGYNDETFSKLFGIEAICYANEKREFLNEAYRIMKPGGWLAVVDVFLTKEHLNVEEQNIYKKFIEGWVVPNLTTQAQFSGLLAQAGFENIVFRNMQKHIDRSVKRVYRCSFLTCPINIVKSRLGIARENLSALYQKFLFDRGIAIYGAFVAQKPNRISKPDDMQASL